MKKLERDVDAFMAHNKLPVHLLLDTGHARWGGSDPAALARACREPIGHVHCRDVREADGGDWSFLDSILGMGKDLGVCTVPGDRMIDYACVFKALKGYSGRVPLETERDPKKAPAPPCAKKGVAHSKAALKEAGLA